MLTLLNFSPAPPITPAQIAQIRASVEAHLDSRFAVAPLEMRVVEVGRERSVEATLDACGLSENEWATQAIVPRITVEHPFAGALLAGVNGRRGYEWPIVREAEKDG